MIDTIVCDVFALLIIISFIFIQIIECNDILSDIIHNDIRYSSMYILGPRRFTNVFDESKINRIRIFVML